MDVTKVTNFIERTDTISAYMAEINKIPELSPEEEKDLFVEYHDCKDKVEAYSAALLDTNFTPEDTADLMEKKHTYEERMIESKNEVITRNLRFNFAVAKRYNTGDMLPDLINVGTIGMYEAFDKYDWREDVRFCTLAVWFIRRAIHAYLNKETQMVRPKNSARIAPKVRKIENEFFLKNGRKPYPIEVIEILRKDYDIHVKDEIDIFGAKVDKIDSIISGDDDFTFEDSQMFNEKTSVVNDYETEINEDEMSYQVNNLMAALTDREKKVICMAFGYGYNKEYKNKEIGHALGLSSERVRQIKNEALKKMRAVSVAS